MSENKEKSKTYRYELNGVTAWLIGLPLVLLVVLPIVAIVLLVVLSPLILVVGLGWIVTELL